jgi:hypothetical protein
MEPDMTHPQLAPTKVQDPNHFVLNGGNLLIRLSLGGIDGEPHLQYQDSHHAMEFSGDEIYLESTSLGQLATVTTMSTKDIGHTSFTLVIPAVDVSAGPQTVATMGLITMHRTRPSSVARGQLRTYHMTELRGSARHVDF